MLNRRSTRTLLQTAAPLIWLLPASAAFALQPAERPFRATPARIVHATPAAGAESSRAIAALGMRTVSRRAGGTPYLMWSSRVAAPKSLDEQSAREAALSAARAIAAELGVKAGDLSVDSSAALDDDFVTVTLRQTWQGLPVHGGALVFTFVTGQLATIRNELVLHNLETIAPALTAREANATALGTARALSADSKLVTAAALELWTAGDRAEDARLAYRVSTRSYAPVRTELTFHVDAESGEVLAADDQVRWANGEGRVHITVDDVNNQSPAVPYTLKFLGLGGNVSTDGDGDAIRPAPVQATATGPYAVVSDQSGRQLESFSVAFGGPFQVLSLTPTLLSQADPFTHVNLAKAYDMQVMPNNQFLFQQLPINVNIADTCNAYFDGQSLNFFQAGNGCANTGRIKTVVYHEFGHGVHASLTNQVDGAVGEGTADFHAAHIADDPVIGQGFMPGTQGGIRALNIPKVYPRDVANEVHEDGLMWATALWDFRTAMITKHGDWAGKRIAYRTFLRAVSQGPSLASAYPSVIAGDDDDNNPANGTPNSCELNRIFDAHGLVTGGDLNHTPAGTRSYVRINHDAPGKFTAGAGGAITISAGAENRSTCGTFNLQNLQLFVAPGLTGGTFSPVQLTVAGTSASGSVTNLQPGDSFRYYFQITADNVVYKNGSDAAPLVGTVAVADAVNLMQEGFEAGLSTWTHGTVSPDATLTDDWEVQSPLGLALDPYAAHSGTKVIGTDLGSGGGPTATDGMAKAGRHTYLQAAPVSTAGKENIRLELWHQYAINGTLRILVDGTEVWSYTGDGTTWSTGWRFLSIPLSDAAKDKASGIVVRFEVEAAQQNVLGGWTIDDVAVTGTAIPPPPPPVMPPPVMTPPKDPPQDPPPSTPPSTTPPSTTPPATTTPGTQTPGGQQQQTPSTPVDANSFAGTVSGGCECVAPAGKRADGGLALGAIALGLALALRRKRR